MEDWFDMLKRRGVITEDPAEKEKCCGIPRDEDGFCVYRPRHPIFLERSRPAYELCGKPTSAGTCTFPLGHAGGCATGP